jgi:hypothetical protein
MGMAVVILRAPVLAVTLLLAGPAGAQDWSQPWAEPLDRPGRVDISASAGFLLPTDWSDLVLLGTISPAFGILEQVLVQNVRIEPDLKYAGGVTYWRGRYGVRADVGYSRSSLSIGDAPLGIGGEPVDVSTWIYGVRGAVGLVEYTPRRVIWPYGFVGIGGITYNLAQPVSPPLLTAIGVGGPAAGGQAGLIVVDQSREFLLRINELDLETEPALSFGLGVDLRIPTGSAGVGLRFELADHIVRSPLRLQIRELGSAGQDTIAFGRVHHLRASMGLVVRVGR